MRNFASASFRILGPYLSADAQSRKETTRALRAARIPTFPEWYLAQSYMGALIGSAAVSLVAIALLWAIDFGLATPLEFLLVVALGVVSFFLVRLTFLLYPRIRMAGRSKKIDSEYQSVVVLSYALAKGGMSTLDIFRTVAREQHTYGEISREFAMVVRDVELFGLDLITALQNGATTTPSQQLRGFFEGLVTILNSGADPRDYYKRQADVQLQRAETDMEAELNSAGMLAEVYVSSFLVLPLLLIVVLSGLSSLGNGQERYIPLVVYGIIPMGTLVYVLMLEVMMPSPDLRVPAPEADVLSDFGVDALPSNAPRLPPPWKMKGTLDDQAALEAESTLGQRIASFWHRTRDHARDWWAKHKEHLVTKPFDMIEISGTVALLVFLGGAYFVWTASPDTASLIVWGTELVMVTLFIAFAPIAVFHEIRVRRARKVEAALPEMLSKLAGFNERGIGILQSFQILGRSTSGHLSAELRAVDRDVRANGNLQNAIRRMRDRVKTMRMTKLGLLLERASRSTSNMKEVLDIAAADETRTEALRTRKRQTMLSYVIVIYLVFAVFLYVTYMVSSLFYGDSAFAISAGSKGSAARIGGGLDPADANILFLHAVVLQGAGSGLVAGRLGEGHTLSGIKHAVIMGGIAFIVFYMGILSG